MLFKLSFDLKYSKHVLEYSPRIFESYTSNLLGTILDLPYKLHLQYSIKNSTNAKNLIISCRLFDAKIMCLGIAFLLETFIR